MNHHQVHEIEQTLSALDHIKKAEASPFLKTRILANLRSNQPASFVPTWLSVTVLTLLLGLLVCNVWLITATPNTNASSQAESNANQFSDIYQLNSNHLVYEN